MFSGHPYGEGIAIKDREALGNSVLVYHVPSSQSDYSRNQVTLR